MLNRIPRKHINQLTPTHTNSSDCVWKIDCEEYCIEYKNMNIYAGQHSSPLNYVNKCNKYADSTGESFAASVAYQPDLGLHCCVSC